MRFPSLFIQNRAKLISIKCSNVKKNFWHSVKLTIFVLISKSNIFCCHIIEMKSVEREQSGQFTFILIIIIIIRILVNYVEPLNPNESNVVSQRNTHKIHDPNDPVNLLNFIVSSRNIVRTSANAKLATIGQQMDYLVEVSLKFQSLSKKFSKPKKWSRSVNEMNVCIAKSRVIFRKSPDPHITCIRSLVDKNTSRCCRRMNGEHH